MYAFKALTLALLAGFGQDPAEPVQSPDQYKQVLKETLAQLLGDGGKVTFQVVYEDDQMPNRTERVEFSRKGYYEYTRTARPLAWFVDDVYEHFYQGSYVYQHHANTGKCSKRGRQPVLDAARLAQLSAHIDLATVHPKDRLVEAGQTYVLVTFDLDETSAGAYVSARPGAVGALHRFWVQLAPGMRITVQDMRTDLRTPVQDRTFELPRACAEAHFRSMNHH